jgi:hypothetical protein
MRFETYAETCIPNRHTVLGLELKDLALGHYLLMRRYDCAYASDTETNVNLTDLILGVLICSMTFEEANEFFNLPPIKFWSVENLKTFGRAWYLSRSLGTTGYEIRCWSDKYIKQVKRQKYYNILSEAKAFQRYLDEGNQMPIYFPVKESDKPSPAHWSIGLHNFLLTKYTKSEAMNLSLRRAFMEYCKWAEEQGSIELAQPYEEDMAKGISV